MSATNHRFHRAIRRLPVAVIVCALAFSGGVSLAVAGVLEDKLAATREQGRAVKRELATVDARQQRLVQQVSRLNERMRTLDGPINELQNRVDTLAIEIDHRTSRIASLKQEYTRQARDIARLNLELGTARDILSRRAVEAYKQGSGGMLQELAASGSISNLIDRQLVLRQAMGVDQAMIDRIGATERTIRLKRAQNQEKRQQIRNDIRSIASDRAEYDAQLSRLNSQRSELASVTSERNSALRKLNARERELNTKYDELHDDAAALQDAIKNGVVTYGGSIPGGPSPNGLIWPVNGPVVSPFAWRWGRMHEGLDIAVGTGTPIHAAAAGVVTYASEMSGYGNMVIIQHAGILSTGYAHQSQIAATVGQTVQQGQVIGFVGCTGHCFGPHLHFETRENGTAVDPMRYL